MLDWSTHHNLFQVWDLRLESRADASEVLPKMLSQWARNYAPHTEHITMLTCHSACFMRDALAVLKRRRHLFGVNSPAAILYGALDYA